MGSHFQASARNRWSYREACSKWPATNGSRNYFYIYDDRPSTGTSQRRGAGERNHNFPERGFASRCGNPIRNTEKHRQRVFQVLLPFHPLPALRWKFCYGGSGWDIFQNNNRNNVQNYYCLWQYRRPFPLTWRIPKSDRLLPDLFYSEMPKSPETARSPWTRV